MIDIPQAARKAAARKVHIQNKDLLDWAGGNDDDWRDQLNGVKANIIARKANQILKDDNKELVSEGIGSQLWLVVTVAEAHRRRAQFNLNRVDSHYINSYNDLVAVVDDVRCSQRVRDDAEAWLALMDEPRSEQGLLIMREFAAELTGKLEQKVPLTAVK